MNPSGLENELEALHSASFGWALACCEWRKHDAEEVLQTVYLKVFDGTVKFEERSSLKTWLFGLIRITAKEQRRRFLRERAALERFAAEPRPATYSKSDWDLQSLLKTLPRRQREVLHLVFYQGMTLEEAATVMEISIGTARTHYERGKHKLRGMLCPEGES